MTTSDKRIAERHDVSLTATVFHECESIGLKCYVRDASTTGCKLVTSQARELPGMIEIVIQGMGQRIPAQVVWRTNKQLGLRFHWPARPKPVDQADDLFDLNDDCRRS